MKNWLTTLLLTSLCLLAGCNGSSGKNDDDNNVGVTPVPTSLSVILVNDDGEPLQSFDKQESITILATVLDQNAQPVTSSRVDFSTDLGQLIADATLTDTDGVASTSLTNNTSSVGAGTVTATIGSLSQSMDFEFLDNTQLDSRADMSIEIRQNGAVTNQFKSSEVVEVIATLQDSQGQPINNEIITFTADIGELSTATALTQNGKATVNLTGADAIGAGIITAVQDSNEAINERIVYEILADDAIVEQDVRIGYIDAQGQFNEGSVLLSIDNNKISAGGTLGLTIDLVDSSNNRIKTPTTVNFNSNCVTNEQARIDTSVLSINGRATSTFEDINCAGSDGTEDVIIASVTANGVTSIATQEIEISGETLGSIEFVSAEPTSIVLKGTGGKENSTVTFLVKGSLGNPLPQQNVEFTLDTDVGGVSLSRSSGVTNSQGLITTQVNAGTVPTPVLVTAKATMEKDGDIVSVQTQSSELSINTGLPDQASITLAASVLNPEASFRGTTSQITVWLADSFNNPVPDGTTVNFTSEGGNIGSECNTENGKCSVTWTAAEPYLSDHRSTILATAIGHETFFDTNGNNTFDDNDGAAIVNAAVESGFGRQTPVDSGFVDMAEAWRDDNENGVKDPEETKFFDVNGDGVHSQADGIFNGPHCNGQLCSDDAKQATLRKAIILIMSSSDALCQLTDETGSTVYQVCDGNSNSIPAIPSGGSASFIFQFSDTAMQTLPFGTTVSITIDGGNLKGQTSHTVSNTTSDGFYNMAFVVENPATNTANIANLIISIKTPNTQDTVYINRTIQML